MKRHAFLSMMVVLGLGLLLGFLVAGSPPSPVSLAAPAGITRYAEAGGLSSGDCVSWTNACELQYALSVAVAGDEIWVRFGWYKPTSETDRSATFQLKSGVEIYGGFPEFGNPGWGDRDLEMYMSALSGDIGTEYDSSDNSYHVVTGSGVTETAVLDGFYIYGGNANGSSPHNEGGGMYNDQGSPTLRNLTFSDNQAWWGGGMRNVDGSSPTLTDVNFWGNTARGGGGMHNEVNSSPLLSGTHFHGNSAWWGGGMRNGNGSNPRLTNVTFISNTAGGGDGGGMHNDPGSSPELTNVTFMSNTASVDGGGMANRANSNPTLTDVTFSFNTAANRGGGMYNWQSSPTLTDVTFSDNTATGDGGGMHNDSASSPALTGVTFVSNTASVDGGGMANADHSDPTLTNVAFVSNTATVDGGGMANADSSDPALTNLTFLGNGAASGGGMYNDTSSPTLTNCILWGNAAASAGDQISNTFSSTPTVSYSLVQGGYTGTGNIDADPLFVDDAAGDLRLQLNSPAIDAGDNDAPGLTGILTDLGGHPRFADVATVADTGNGLAPIVDMGAREAPPGRIYVDADAAGKDDGSSWADALPDLQSALTWAMDSVEIWVAEGTYQPGTEREDSFHLVSGVAVYGGFTGTEGSRGERNPDPATNNTVLSGDIGVGGDSSDNSYQVVTGSGTDATAVLDGFTISGGNANGSTPYDAGGGMINDGGSPTLANLTFSGNTADLGGGMFNIWSSPTLTNCRFTNNIADSDWGGDGGGMHNDTSSPALTNVAFISNTADYAGGGMYNSYDSSPALSNVTFISNTAAYGGGMYHSASPTSSLTLTNVAFTGNSAGDSGGGMHTSGSSSMHNPSLTLINVTFSGNTAPSGGGMFNHNGSSPALTNVTFSGNTALGTEPWNGGGGGMHNGFDSNPTLTNCILWGNVAASAGDQISNTFSSTPTISYSDIEGSGGSEAWDASLGIDGGNNIDADPLFQDADGADGIAGTADDNLRLGRGSAAIDAGHNGSVPSGITEDLDGNPRFFADLNLDGEPDVPDGPVDMGAYEAQYGWYMSLGDERLDTGRAYRTGFHVGQTLTETLAAYDVTPLLEADDSYALAPGRPDLPPEIPTEDWLGPRLDACWEIATGELLAGNQDVVEALDPRLTGAYPTLPAQIAELGAAKDRYVQAADAYLDLLAGELYTPAVALQPGRVNPITGTQPYADVQRLAQAAAKKSGAYLALAERYFRQYTDVSKLQARATLEEGWELAEADLALLAKLAQDWPGAWDDDAYGTAYQALLQNIADLQRVDSHLDEGKNPFGYDTDYVPFHPVQGTAEPPPNFEYWWEEARWDDPAHDDYHGYGDAKHWFDELLASQRKLDHDQGELTKALDDLNSEYEDRLGELCGYDGGSVDYEGCHGGEMGLQVDEIRGAKLRVERVIQQMENQAELIRIEQQRAADVAGIHRAVAVMYRQTGRELTDLARKEAELRFTKSELGANLDIFGAALSMFDEGGTNFGGFGGLLSGALGMMVEGLKIQEQNQVGRELADVAAKQAEIEAYQQSYVKYADARIEDANSEALIKEYLLEFALLDLDLALALNELEQELARLEGMTTEVEYLLARWAEARRSAVDLYLDPAERVFRDDYAERASHYFDLALETAYRAARALDYEMAQTWSGEQQGYGLVGTDNLFDHLGDMNAVYQNWDSTGQEWCHAIKLSEAMGFVDSMVLSGTQRVWTTAQDKFEQYVSNADNWVDLDGKDGKESLRLNFETSIEEPYRFFSRNVYNDKILYYNIVLMGEQRELDVSGNGTRVALRQAGTSTVRDSTSEPFGEDSYKGYSLEPTPLHQVAALYNVGPGVCNETQPYAGYGFYWRSVYCTDWVLTIDATANEPDNYLDIDFTALDEIEIRVRHRDFPFNTSRLVAAPPPEGRSITTAAKLSHLASDPDAAHRFAGTLYAEQPEYLPPQPLALLLVETGGVVSGAIESEALLGYPTDPGTGLGPALSGTVADGLFLLGSEAYTVSSEAMTHQLFLTTTSATSMTIGGEYVERIGGLAPAPIEIRGAYTLTRSFLGPQAAFSASPASGADPLQVTFIDGSQGDPTTWAWDFGDGATWVEHNPTLPYTLTHTYDLPGTYTVTLTVSSLFGSDTYTETDCVTVGRFRVYLPLVMRSAP